MNFVVTKLNFAHENLFLFMYGELRIILKPTSVNIYKHQCKDSFFIDITDIRDT